MGLSESAAEFFPDAAWQRCIVHWYRNVFSHVPSTKVREAAAMLKAIHAGEDIAAARQKAVQVIEKLRGLRLTTAAQLVEGAVEETLAYYAFPEEAKPARATQCGSPMSPSVNWQALTIRHTETVRQRGDCPLGQVQPQLGRLAYRPLCGR